MGYLLHVSDTIAAREEPMRKNRLILEEHDRIFGSRGGGVSLRRLSKTSGAWSAILDSSKGRVMVIKEVNAS